LAGEGTAQDVRTYDHDPGHLWNRLHAALFIRTAADGTTYGHDRLDPLYWGRTEHLLEERSHRQALQVLDEFLKKRGERQVRDPLKRAFLQHDLWALFDWSALPYSDRYDRERAELQQRLVQVMRRLALSKEALTALPDNYARAAASADLATLPRNLFQSDGEWVMLSVSGGRTAPRHVEHFGGRSAFHVLLRLPEGRAATLAYIERLRLFERPWIYIEPPSVSGESIVMNPEIPRFSPRTEWALVRRMRGLDTDGEMRATPVIESIQVRRYVALGTASLDFDERQAFMFVASRARDGELRAVLPGERDFYQFQAHDADPFELSAESLAWYREHRVSDPFRNRMQRDVLRDCFTCHGAQGMRSVQSLAVIANDRVLAAHYFVESDPGEVLNERARGSSYQYGLLRGLWGR
jgi:hypothetical protein